MHHCVNLVCGPGGTPSAVLIRSLEPLWGLEAMHEARRVGVPERLARGPGCVTQALGLDLRHDGLDLGEGPVWVTRDDAVRDGFRIARGPRIGIRQGLDRDWRYWLAGHPCVSGRRGAPAVARTLRTPVRGLGGGVPR
jgi:DNA-3-methyladenine glycosylase